MIFMREKTAPQNAPASRRLRVMTYNVRNCRGRDGICDPARIAEVIAHHQPDIVGLQEVDVARRRSGGVDQAQAIAMHLKMTSHFHPALHVAEERYGDAILTTLPSRLIKAGPLPSLGEQRGALWVAVTIGDEEVNVFNTHLGLRPRERIRQVETLLGPTWLGHPDARVRPTIFMGDFNAGPSSAPFKLLSRHFMEVQAEAADRPRATFPAWFPLLRIDHIFVRGLAVTRSHVDGSGLARRASDHLPLVASVAQRTGHGATSAQ